MVAAGLFPTSLLDGPVQLEAGNEPQEVLDIIASWNPRPEIEEPTSAAASSGSASHVVTSASSSALLPVQASSAKEKAYAKYTSSHQRTTQYNEQPARRSRAPVARSGLDLKRMSPNQLVRAMIEDGLFEDLASQPCRNEACLQNAQKGFGTSSVFGKFSATTEG
ncbi:unnamed protein product [Polarella glacialis]|uniref:Uncharacterized protein n=1 Tax=Polarella glacialis TaxID=89957 RepID=A0A813KYL8_POLGL|nr:unnamed protein product [Polarella glacialis]